MKSFTTHRKLTGFTERYLDSMGTDRIPGLLDLIIYSLPAVMTGIIVCIPVHEAGHLLFGLLSGYRFSSFECFGISAVMTTSGLKLRIDRHPCIGQCIMYPVDLKKDGSLLILGGILNNLFASVIASGMALIIRNGFLAVLFCAVSVINLVAAVTNLMPGNGTNDGSTLTDACKSDMHMEAYNRLMIIYNEINSGKTFGEIKPELFEMPDLVLSSLSSELAFYRYLNKENTGNGDTKIEVKRLERHATLPGEAQYILEGCDFGRIGKTDRSYGCGHHHDDHPHIVGKRDA